MRLARYRVDEGVHYGSLENGLLKRVASGPFGSLELTGEVDRIEDVRLLAPIVPTRVFAIGMNYKGHIEESGAKVPEIPMVFMMPSTAVIGPEDPIVLPKEATLVHHESELAIVIGRQGRRISRVDALDHVLGFTCANDVSERAIQAREIGAGSITISKGFDTFCPIGPVVATGIDPSALRVTATVNGEVRQDGNTSDLLFDIPFLIEYVSRGITLLPGDIILTGTPSGVGPLVPGDRCEIEIEGIGLLSNPVVAEPR